MKEIWKDVQGFEGLYKISNFGRIKNHKGKILKPSIGRYINCMLSKNDVRYYFGVHRLVALHFILNPQNKPTVNHKDGNKHNNMVWNLEWSTQKEQMEHAVMTGLHSYIGEGNKYSKLKNSDIPKILNLIGKMKQKEIGKLFNVNDRTISNINLNKSWKNIIR